MPYPHAYRVVVTGGERVGKTAIIEQLIFGNHVIGQSGVPTVADIYDIVVETEKGSHERLQLFDTAGSLFTASGSESDLDFYLQVADGFILVYEITSNSSFDLAMTTRQKIMARNKDVPMVVLGNKSDCNAIRQVKDEAMKIWARSNGVRPYEVTVANRDGLKDPFCYLAWRMANPSRGFSAMPLLTAAANIPRPHGHAHHSPSDDAEDTRSGVPSPLMQLSEGPDDPSATPLSSDYPDDALFPNKLSPANLFLRDCYGTKNKETSEQTSV